MEPVIQILSWYDVLMLWLMVALAAAVLNMFDREDPKLAYVFAFQLGGTFVIQVGMATYRNRVLGWLPPKALLVLQPALLIIALLIALAGGTWPDGFMDGLTRYMYRVPLLPNEERPSVFRTEGFWQHVGPGELINLGLNPAIAVLAFPTSTAMKAMGENLGLVCFASCLSALFSLVLMIALGDALVPDEAVALSLIPHSTTTAVALGLAPLLCDGKVCASDPIVATTCILTGLFQMLFGPKLMTMIGVKDPVSRGVSIGSAGMALGVAGLRTHKEEVAAGVAAMSSTVFPLATAVLVSLANGLGAPL